MTYQYGRWGPQSGPHDSGFLTSEHLSKPAFLFLIHVSNFFFNFNTGEREVAAKNIITQF